jgi:hypothetical protein
MCDKKLIAKSVKPFIIEEDKSEPEKTYKKTLEIKDNDTVIAAFLSARGFEISKKASENRQMLSDYTASEEMKLIREWSLKIILPDGEETKASVTNTLSLKDLLDSLVGRGYEFPKKVAFTSNGKIINSLEKLTYKSTLNIITRS